MKATRYLQDFIWYYQKAHWLQQRNLAGLCQQTYRVGCPLQDNVPIYNNVHRRYAGFSKILEDLHGRRNPILGADNLGFYERRYLELVHRVTGSGASFETDHGYRNTCLFELAKCGNVPAMAQLLKEWDFAPKRLPIFTSIGNQIPPFNKPSRGFKSGGFQYLVEYAPVLAWEYSHHVSQSAVVRGPLPQRELVDWCLDWHAKHGLKKFHFVLTAWVMDTAEYEPHLVDRKSLTYYGKNALECLELLFEREGEKKQEFYDYGVLHLCGILDANPYDLEDCLCDYIRYVENYVPPDSYGHLALHEIQNNSLVQDHPKRLVPGRHASQ